MLQVSGPGDRAYAEWDGDDAATVGRAVAAGDMPPWVLADWLEERGDRCTAGHGQSLPHEADEGMADILRQLRGPKVDTRHS